MRLSKPSFFILLILLSNSSFAQSQSERLQRLVEQWLSLEQQADQLRHDWSHQQLVLQQRLQLLQTEKKVIKKHLRLHSGRQNKAQQARADLAQQSTVLEQNQAQLSSVLVSVAASIKALSPRLPEPLAQHWENIFKHSDKHKSNSEKLARYLSALKAMDEFQQKITRHQSLMEISGQQVLVDQIYLGLAQGWYLSRDGKLAGIGRPGQDSWRWRPDNSLAPMLKDIIAALKQPEKASVLPIRVELASQVAL